MEGGRLKGGSLIEALLYFVWSTNLSMSLVAVIKHVYMVLFHYQNYIASSIMLDYQNPIE